MKYSHTYKNKLGKDVKCFIDFPTNPDAVNTLKRRSQNFEVAVENENGCCVFLNYKKLTPIKNA